MNYQTHTPTAKYLNAVVVVIDRVRDPVTGRVTLQKEFKKYHNIKDTVAKLRSFAAFVKQEFPKAECINYYWRDQPRGQNFAFRAYFN